MARTQALVVGSDAAALLTALTLHHQGQDVALVDPLFEQPPTFTNPSLGLLGGQDNMVALTLAALQGWSGAAEMVDDEGLEVAPWLDLATSPALVRKLQDESVLDVLAGYDIRFEAQPSPVAPPWLQGDVLGFKYWEESPLLPTDLIARLREKIRQAPVFVHTQEVMTLDITQPEAPVLGFADGTRLTAQPLILASSAVALRLLPLVGLPLPLRPACGHVLEWALPEDSPLRAEETPPTLLHRLPQGHVWMFQPEPGRLVAHYDALCDASQARFGHTSAPALETALATHVQKMTGVEGVPTSTLCVPHWVTPDYLPALGVWPGLKGLILAVGLGPFETLLAPLVASVAVAECGGEPALPQPLLEVVAPNRFARGVWEKVSKPGSLDIAPLNSPAVRVVNEPVVAHMEKINMVEEPEIQRAGTIHQVEKTATRVASLTEDKGGWGHASKPKIQMAGVKTSS